VSENVRLHFTCSMCVGRGWIPSIKGPPFIFVGDARCSVCGGRGTVLQLDLSRRLGVDVHTVERLSEGRARPSTCERVFPKLAEMAGL
jgi:hypothetical protein